MNGRYGWADALEILKAMKEGEYASETRVERCVRLSQDRPIVRENTQSPSSAIHISSTDFSSSEVHSQDGVQSDTQLNSHTGAQWDFESQNWNISPSTHSPSSSVKKGPMHDIWMQIHHSLSSLSQSHTPNDESSDS